MFSWFTGGDDKPAGAAAEAPGFHPIVLPPDTPANPYTAGASTSPPPPPSPSRPSTTASSGAAAVSRESVAPSPQLPSAQEETPPAPSSSSSLLFTGMEVGKGRRRRPPVQTTVAGSAEQPPEVKTPGDGGPRSPHNAAATQAVSVSQIVSEDAAPLHARLERFYRHYNAGKLAHINAIMEAYAGRDAQLFEELVQRYGPEPVPLSPAKLAAADLLGGHDPHPTGTPSESEVSAFHFLASAAPAANAAESAPPPAPAGSPHAPAPAAAGRDAAPSANLCSPSSSSSGGSSVSGGETTAERQRRELRECQGTLLEARAALASVLHDATLALQQRRQHVRALHTLDERIQECVKAEDYRRADALSDETQEVARAVQACDSVWGGLSRRVAAAQRSLDDAVRGLASLLRAHEVQLLAEAEAEQRDLQSRLHVDDADLRLREERSRVRRESISERSVKAQAKLATAEAAQAELQRSIDAALSTTRTQQESLSDEVASLDEQIDEMKARLRQLEARRATAAAQLKSVTEKMDAARAAHGVEVDAAAAEVQRCEAELRRVQELASQLDTEESAIQTERAAREAAAAALRAELEARQAERLAVQQRTRALEQETIPASDRCWRAWQEVFARRLEGADVLFEVPAAARLEERGAKAPSAVSKKAQLLKQLSDLGRELQAQVELCSDAQRRLEAWEARVAPLLAAKAAAVSSKNFKAAQHCADELRAVQVSVDGCQGDVELYGGQVRALERTMGRLRDELAAAEVETRRHAAAFTRDYGALMGRLADAGAAVAQTPDYVQLPKGCQGTDELAAAAAELRAALQDEWQQCEASSRDPAADAGASSSTPEASALRCDEAVEDAVGAAAGAEAPPQDGEAPLSAEALQAQLTALQASMDDAMAREDYGECDSLQQAMDRLETQLRGANSVS